MREEKSHARAITRRRLNVRLSQSSVLEPSLPIAGFNLPVGKSHLPVAGFVLPVGKCLLSVNLLHLPVAG
jgi:hypothetical protein